MKLWDVATGKEIRSFAAVKSTVYCVAFSPDGSTALSGSYDRTLTLWDLATALNHASFGLTVSILGVQAAFYHYRKIPFACSWVPGKLKLQLTVFPCLIGLLLSMTALAAVERSILAEPSRALIFYALAAGVGLALRLGNARFYRRTPYLLYDEVPEAAMIELPSGD
jgi:hypothetical protein